MPLMPRPATDERSEIRKADTKRLGRAFGLVAGCFSLCLVAVSLLPTILQTLRIRLPIWLMGSLFEFVMGSAGLFGGMCAASFLR